MDKSIIHHFEANPIIAGVRNTQELINGLKSPVETIFLLGSKFDNLSQQIQLIRFANKLPFIHAEMIDTAHHHTEEFIEYLKELNPLGVITSNANLVLKLKKAGFVVIQRVFIIDSYSVKTGIELAKKAEPDLIELLPGMVFKTIPFIRKMLKIPIIAGGLVTTKKEMIELLKAGCLAVCTSEQLLWEL